MRIRKREPQCEGASAWVSVVLAQGDALNGLPQHGETLVVCRRALGSVSAQYVEDDDTLRVGLHCLGIAVEMRRPVAQPPECSPAEPHLAKADRHRSSG